MGTSVVVAEKSSTVRRMVEIAIHGLDMDIHCADHGEAAIQAVRDNAPALLIIRNDLPGMNAYDVAREMQTDAALSHIPVVLLLGRNDTPDLERANGLNFSGQLNLPFKTQALVEIVCNALALDTPDIDLYRPYMMEIPLAHATPEVETQETPEVPIVEDTAVPGIDPQMLIETTSRADMLTLDTTTDDGSEVATELPEAINDSFGEAVTRQDISQSDAFASTEVYTIKRPTLDTMELSVDELTAVPAEASSDSNRTHDDMASADEEDIITNVVPPAAPVAPLPDVDELVERVTAAISEGSALQGALSEISREVIEQVAWEVVPALAEALLKEEISRLIRREPNS